MAKEQCDRNCATCGAENRSYCAVQMAIANQELLMSISNTVNELAAISNSQTQLIPPAATISEPTVPGAETIND